MQAELAKNAVKYLEQQHKAIKAIISSRGSARDKLAAAQAGLAEFDKSEARRKQDVIASRGPLAGLQSRGLSAGHIRQDPTIKQNDRRDKFLDDIAKVQKELLTIEQRRQQELLGPVPIVGI